MYEHNQSVIPDSFIALFLAPGRPKPSASRQHIGERYELCEDLANHLVDYARAQHFDLGIGEADVLERCHLGLQAESSGLGAAEAQWVIRRLAELSAWPCIAFEAPR